MSQKQNIPKGQVDDIPWRTLSFIFSVALLIRIIYLFEISKGPTFLTPVVDSRLYDDAARALLDYRGWKESFFMQGFFYPLFLSLCYKLSSGSILFAKSIQAVLGSLTCVLTYLLGRKIYGHKPAIIAGLAVAFYGPLFCLEGELLSSGWGAFWAVTLVLLFQISDTDARRRPRWLFLLGIAGALAITTRGPLLIPFMAGTIWLAFRFYRRSLNQAEWLKTLTLPLGFALIATPVAFQYHAETGQYSILPARSGINLYIGNHVDRVEMINARPGPEWNSILHLPYQEKAFDLWEQNNFFKRKVVSYIKEHPVDFLAGLAAKSHEFLISREIPRNYDIYLFRDWSVLLSTLMWKVGGVGFPFGLLLPLSIIGLVTRRRETPFHLPLFIVSYAATIVLVFVSARYRVLIIPLLAVPFGAGVIFTFDSFRKKTLQLITIISATLFVSILLTSVPTRLAIEGDPLDFEQEMIYYQALDSKRRGERQESMIHLANALKIDPLDPQLLTNYGSELMNSGDRDGAELAFRKVLQSIPSATSASNNLGVVLSLKGETEEAIRLYENVIKDNPLDSRAYSNLGTIFAKTGQNNKAIDNFRKAVRINPWDGNSFYNLGVLLAGSGKNIEAGNNLRQAKKAAIATNNQDLANEVNKAVKNINSAPFQIKKAAQLIKAGSYEKSLKLLISSFSESQPNYDVMAQITDLYLKTNNLKSAKVWSEQMIKFMPKNGLGYYLRGKTLIAAKKDREALAAFLKAKQYAPENRALLVELGKTHMKLNELVEAQTVFLEALKLSNSNNGPIHYYLAVALRKSNDNQKSIDHYLLAIDLMPDHTGALNDLAVLYASRGENFDKAIQLAEKALKSSRNAPLYADSLGWVLLQAGHIERAITYFQNAAAALPKNKLIQAHLKSALQQQKLIIKE